MSEVSQGSGDLTPRPYPSENIPTTGTFVELGCGPVPSKWTERVGPGSSYTFLDGNERSIADARSLIEARQRAGRMPGVRTNFAQCDMAQFAKGSDLPAGLLPGNADVVIAMNVFSDGSIPPVVRQGFASVATGSLHAGGFLVVGESLSPGTEAFDAQPPQQVAEFLGGLGLQYVGDVPAESFATIVNHGAFVQVFQKTDITA